MLLREVLNKDKNLRPSALEVQNHIWFNDITPMTMELEDHPNLFEAILNIAKDKIKTKRIRKQRELKEIISPTNLAKARAKFLLHKEEEVTIEETIERFLKFA